jgi:hypothetical protein
VATPAGVIRKFSGLPLEKVRDIEYFYRDDGKRDARWELSKFESQIVGKVKDNDGNIVTIK